MSPGEPALRVSGLRKHYGPVRALDGLDMELREGAIHLLLGQNGAGKSTLLRILHGETAPDRGEISLFGRSFRPRSPRHAILQGVGLLPQQPRIIPNMTLMENVLLSCTALPGVGAGSERLRREARDYGMELPFDESVEALPAPILRDMEILRLLAAGPRLLLFDEPTAVMDSEHRSAFYRLLARLKESGKTVLLVTHRLSEVIGVADAATVVKLGRVVDELSGEDLCLANVLKHFRSSGQEAGEEPRPEAGRTLFSFDGLRARDRQVGPLIEDVSMDLREGRAVCLLGAPGNGQEILLKWILNMPVRGPVEFTCRSTNPGGADWSRRRSLFSFVPGDARSRGCVAEMSVRDNSLLGAQRVAEGRRGLFIRPGRLSAWSEHLLREHCLGAGDPRLPVAALSGGNIQRFVVGRETERDEPILLLEEPGRGLDVQSVLRLRRLILEQRNRGKTVLLVTSDPEEALALADEISVIYRGRIIMSVERDGFDLDRINAAIMGYDGTALAERT